MLYCLLFLFGLTLNIDLTKQMTFYFVLKTHIFSEKQNDVIHFLIILTTFYFHKTKRTQKKALNITFYNTDLTIYFETFKREITKSL